VLYGRKIANTLFITLHQICSNQYYILIGGIGMNQEIKEALTLVLTKLENLEESGIRSLKGELSSLYGYIGIFRSDTIRDQNKNETYLKVLTKQIYDMQKTLDFVRAHIERQREWDEED
jgi:ATP-dependent 26S proteasome regulatory subunit